MTPQQKIAEIANAILANSQSRKSRRKENI
jgi:hypothetical protein